MPLDRARYPKDWSARAFETKEKAGWKCEECGMGHMADGTMGSCLTVHHPDRDPENQEARTRALCARCHLKDEPRARRAERDKDQFGLFETKA